MPSKSVKSYRSGGPRSIKSFSRRQSTSTITTEAIRSNVGVNDISASPGEGYKEPLLARLHRVAKLVLPHVGLVLLLVVYTVLGAGVFHMIEFPNEVEVREKTLNELNQRREKIMDNLWTASRGNTSLDRDAWFVLAAISYRDLELQLLTTFDQRHFTIEDLQNQTREIWTFPASIFFASTVITTIGYGHMVPMTLPGRIFCIGFGLFGIPLLLITIADIGKFLSDLITFIYKSYRRFATRIRRTSRKISSFRRFPHWSRTSSGNTSVGGSEESEEIHIPVWMVLLFLATYTALGGLLFRLLEGWTYFESFYFCFITMATIGFGDLVPSKQMYMFFTMIYIVIGLAVTTMCIDLAGTEYIRKIHYFGHKFENAKEIFETGLHAGGDWMKQMRLAGDILNVKNMALLGKRGMLPSGFALDGLDPMNITEEEILMGLRQATNILYEPVSPAIQRYLKPNIKITPDEITESDAWILENKMYGRPTFTSYRRPAPGSQIFHSAPRPRQPARVSPVDSDKPIYIAPFIWRESNL